MSDDPDQPDDPEGPGPQSVQHSPISARVPPSVARGVFSTGVVVFNGPSECVLDFVVRLGSPHQIVARVVITPMVLGQFIGALNENLAMYSGRFGNPPSLPTGHGQPPGQGQHVGQSQQGGQGGPTGQAPSSGPPNANTIEDLYSELKLNDELLSGVYANAVMIGHTPAEFWFDFITNFFPRSAVSCRVYMTAQQVPGVLDTLNTSFKTWKQRMEGEGGMPE